MEELIQKIILKAYKVNKNTEHTVFVDFMGHVNCFQIYLYLNGWKENSNPDIKIETYLDEKFATENLQYMLNKLEELEGKECLQEKIEK